MKCYLDFHKKTRKKWCTKSSKNIQKGTKNLLARVIYIFSVSLGNPEKQHDDKKNTNCCHSYFHYGLQEKKKLKNDKEEIFQTYAVLHPRSLPRIFNNSAYSY